MARRPPSASQLGSQLRSEMRKAERKAMREMKSAVQKAEREVTAELRRSERRMTREIEAELSRSERALQGEVKRAADRQQRQLSRRTPRSSISYTPRERTYLTSVREAVATDQTERERDAFLCHAWADRKGAAAEFYTALVGEGVDVWFSEEDLVLGVNLPRQLDRGIARSLIGIVLVTPALLAAVRAGGFAEQELGALLTTGRVIPVCHQVTYEGLRAESPLLAAQAGLSTEGSSLPAVAAKIADSVLHLG